MASSESRSTGLVASTMRVFELSIGQMLWSRRSIFLGVLVVGPVILAATYTLAKDWVARGQPDQVGG